MRTTTKKEEVKEVVEQPKMDEAFVLWRNKSKKGGFYLSGNTIGENSQKLIGFFNTNKENPKAPDIRVFTTDQDGKQDKEVCSLWENISKNETRYLTGTTDEKEKIVAFYGEEHQEARPYIRAYYRLEK